LNVNENFFTSKNYKTLFIKKFKIKCKRANLHEQKMNSLNKNLKKAQKPSKKGLKTLKKGKKRLNSLKNPF